MTENDHNAGLAAGEAIPDAASPQRQAHTPGPWLRDGHMVYALHHYGWANGQPRMVNRFSASVQIYNGVPLEEAEANAHLIAAAPDLLAALKAVVHRSALGTALFHKLTEEHAEAALAAIAKAEGKS